MKSRLLMSGILFALLTVANVSHAEINSEREIARCAVLKGSGERLSCFDQLAKKLGVDKPITKMAAGSGKWRVSESTSKIDDSTTVYATVESNDSIAGKFGRARPSLWVRCAENKTEVFINVGLYLGLRKTSVLTRLDKEKASTSDWSISTDTKAVFAPASPIKFTKKLMNHEKLLVQLTPYHDNPATFEFDIGGLPEAIAPLRSACHW